MSQTFVHSSVFNIKELEKKEFGFWSQVNSEPFVVVHNSAFLAFNLSLKKDFSKTGTGHAGFVFLEHKEEGKKLEVSYKINAKKSDGSSLLLQDWTKSRRLRWDESDFGIFSAGTHKPIASSFAEEKKFRVTDLEDNLLQEDGSSIRVSVQIKVDKEYFNHENELESKIDALAFKHTGFFKQVYEELTKGQSTDVDYNLLCSEKEKRKFPCHKWIIRRRSVYFEHLLSIHPAFDQEDVHEVAWSPEVTEEILYFIYNDEKSPKFDSVPVEELLQLAQMLELEKLLRICEKSLMARTSKTNAWEYLSIADTHKMKSMKKRALCVVTEDENLAETLMDDHKSKKMRKEVTEFALKRGRAQVLVV